MASGARLRPPQSGGRSSFQPPGAVKLNLEQMLRLPPRALNHSRAAGGGAHADVAALALRIRAHRERAEAGGGARALRRHAPGAEPAPAPRLLAKRQGGGARARGAGRAAGGHADEGRGTRGAQARRDIYSD